MKLSTLQRTIVPVVVIDTQLSADRVKQLVAAVQAGGSACLEITLRTPQALAAVESIKTHCPDFIVGVGTVLDTEQAMAAMAVGADFLVSPGLSPATVEVAEKNNNLMIPGVITPSEMQQAMALGLEIVKFFPAEQAGGAAMLKAFHAVYPNMQIMPTGGINQANLPDYAALPNVFAVGGSWVCNAKDIAEGNYTEISKHLRLANACFE